MKAMILAAGFGTRLRPLTLVRPKPLVPVMGVDLLSYWIHKLHAEGFEAVVVNAFHLADQVVKLVGGRSWPLPVHVRVESKLLGTAGGLRNALNFLGAEPFAVVNGDVICNVSVRDLYEGHLRSGCSVSLLVHDFPPFNNVVVQDERWVVEFGQGAVPLGEAGFGEVRMKAFTGIYCLNPGVISIVPLGSSWELVPLLRRHLRDGVRIRAVSRSDFFWREIGTVESYRKVHHDLALWEGDSLRPLPTGQPIRFTEGSRVSGDTRLEGFVVTGRNCRVGGASHLENTVLWDHVEVKEGSRLSNCIVTDGGVVEGYHHNEVILGELRP